MTGFVDELVAVARLFGLAERDAVCCGTVTVPQCIALQALLPGDRMVSELASHAGVSNSAMTRLVDGLEKKGWVQRTRSETDRRKVTIGLTESGEAEAGRLRSATARCGEVLLDAVPADKRDQVLESLTLVRQALERSQGGGSCC